MSNALMIDLETLSTQKNAAVLQAGWCMFDPQSDDISYKYEQNVCADSCLSLDGHVSDSTVRWWLNGTPEARQSVSKPGRVIFEVLKELVRDYRGLNCTSVWSNGSCFDIVILEHYFSRLGMAPPWKFWDIMDTRTLWATATQMGWSRKKDVVAHTALDDAVAQAIQVQSAMAFIRGLRP